MLRLAGDPAYIDNVLAEGAEKARAIARPNMDAVKDILGLTQIGGSRQARFFSVA